MPEQRITFEYLDQDTEPRLMQPGASRYMLNCRVGGSLNGNRGAIETPKGNELVYLAMPDGVNQVIGQCEDKESEACLYFVYNSNGNHAILRYDARANTISTVFQWEGLRFSSFRKITGCAVIDKLLFWTDNFNEPRKINIERALRGEYEPLKATEKHFLNMLVPAPAYPLIVSREKDAATPQNLIGDLNLQFAYRYQYVDGAYSVLSPASRMLPMAREKSEADASLNRVRVLIPGNEKASRLVLNTEVMYRSGNNGKWRIFTTVARDGSGQFPEKHYFYNNGVAYAVDEAAAAKPSEAIPNAAAALGIAKNRVFLANCREGYGNSSAQMALSAVKVAIGSSEGRGQTYGDTAYTHRYEEKTYKWQYDYGLSKYRWALTKEADTTTEFYIKWQDGYYYLATWDAAQQVALLNLSSQTGKTHEQLTYKWDSDETRFDGYILSRNPSFKRNTLTDAGARFIKRTDVGQPGTGELEDYRVFKSNSSYQVGILFKDYGLRNAGVAAGTRKIATSPVPDLITEAESHIRWELAGDGAAEIPEWATHYHIVRTRNQAMASFIQGVTADVAYARASSIAATGFDYSYTYRPNYDHVLIDVSTLYAAGIGYVFSPGDQMRLVIGGSRHELPITGQYGKFLAVGLRDLGMLNDKAADNNFRFEIYTPYKAAGQETFYEVGEAFPVLQPGEADRDYSLRSGTMQGDCYLVSRKWHRYAAGYDINKGDNELEDFGNTIYVEAASPSDRQYDVWDSDIGRVTVQLAATGQLHKKASIRFGNTYIQGTQLNGLCEFEALNEYHLPLENGPIAKLQPVGNVLLALQQSEATSIYVGLTEITDTAGQTLISVSDRVLGSNRPLGGGYGCQHPETVWEHEGSVYWFDGGKGAVLRYAGNGITDISALMMSSFFRRKAAEQRKTPTVICAGFDPLNQEYLITIGNETVGFRENLWSSFYSFSPEAYGGAGNRLLSFFGGGLYLHESASVPRNNFYGVQHKSVAEASVNEQSGQVKVLQRLRLEATAPWGVPVITNPDGQESELGTVDFEEYEKQYYAEFLRDRKTPHVDFPLFEGDEMRSTNFSLRLEYEGSGAGKLLAANVGYFFSNLNQLVNP